MAGKSALRRLPPELRAEINRILSEGRLTLDELLAHLRGLGVESVSRSALGRQKQKIDRIAAKLRQSREMTEALVREAGPHFAEGEQGRLLVQILRDLIFEHLTGRDEDEEPDADPKNFMALARALKDMAQANRLDQDFETRVRERVEKEARAKIEAAAESVATESGLDAAALKNKLLEAYGG